ncbi:fibroblast growth factor receptor 2-like isoform X2 [Acanthaster planci]|uniref:receptor protein-tyrosine kinase n=1 Tax=Acanthaster planci TaxID=133434 RepID=A0A8B7XRN8_ACAPL|nr:fibroblast growth factor receptor 2-like isoform X2 [Acanthaster planci]
MNIFEMFGNSVSAVVKHLRIGHNSAQELHIYVNNEADFLMINFTGSCELNLSMNASVLVEGEPVQFVCSPGKNCEGVSSIRWFLNGSRPSEGTSDFEETTWSSSNFNLVPHRNLSGLLLECRMLLDGVIRPFVRSMILDVAFPPRSAGVTVSNGSLNCSGTCHMKVNLSQTYEFSCQTLDSNPACIVEWTLQNPSARLPTHSPSKDLKTSAVSWRQKQGWDSTSTLRLTALPDFQRRSLVCSISHPDNLTMFREIRVVLLVNTGSVDASIIIIVGCWLAFVIVCLILAYAVKSAWVHEKGRRYRLNSDQPSAVQEKNDESSEVMEALIELEGPRTARGVLWDKVTILNKIGEGAFGVVYKANADGIIQEGKVETVAVKMIKEWVPGSSMVSDFMKELNICRTLQTHPNVITMLGCCVEKEPYCLIFEYAPNGNLAKFLMQKKAEWKAKRHGAPVSSDLIIKFACQIANGMHYLSSVKIIHRDLATRNILLDENLTCKVSDFGFSRDVFTQNFYQMSSSGAVPVRWMALESIVDDIYTTKSDVWSYGILVWEMITMGTHPYPGIKVTDLIDALKDGRRLPKPSYCGGELYKIMKECWHPTPTCRPDFADILQTEYLQMTKFTPDYDGYQ